MTLQSTSLLLVSLASLASGHEHMTMYSMSSLRQQCHNEGCKHDRRVHHLSRLQFYHRTACKCESTARHAGLSGAQFALGSKQRSVLRDHVKVWATRLEAQIFPSVFSHEVTDAGCPKFLGWHVCRAKLAVTIFLTKNAPKSSRNFEALIFCVEHFRSPAKLLKDGSEQGDVVLGECPRTLFTPLKC